MHSLRDVREIESIEKVVFRIYVTRLKQPYACPNAMNPLTPAVEASRSEPAILHDTWDDEGISGVLPRP